MSPPVGDNCFFLSLPPSSFHCASCLLVCGANSDCSLQSALSGYRHCYEYGVRTEHTEHSHVQVRARYALNIYMHIRILTRTPYILRSMLVCEWCILVWITTVYMRDQQASTNHKPLSSEASLRRVPAVDFFKPHTP